MDNSNNQEPTQGVIKISARVINLKLRTTSLAWHPATDLGRDIVALHHQG